MGSKGGGGGGSTVQSSTVQKADPWSEQQPYLKEQYQTAQQLGQQPSEFYPGQTFSSFSPETEAALAAQTNRAVQGSPLTGASQQNLTDTLNGNFLSAGNPYFQNMADKITAQVQPQIDADFASHGRFGSGLHGRAIGEGLGSALGALAYQNYGDERARQMQAAGMAPQAAQQDYFDIAKLAEAGGAREDLVQQAINEAMARYNYQFEEPWQRLGQYASIVQGSAPGGSTSTYTTNPGFRQNIGAGLLGGAATGAGLGSLLGSGSPYAMGGGALLGALMGLG